ncbi:MAG TPA: TetR/AcrR family transcriptional regulator [Candidatus Limnocylindrales bacterium]|nr:TetR/AcrR family transcriptional regulator [Candidatus Limnocylindrales bacterium]
MTQASRLLAEQPHPSIAAIATAAGVSKTTFYRVFPSRADLLQALKVEPKPESRQRVLEAAVTLLRTHSLADLSMDELAERARISRANLYRLYPGKPALFRAILLAYSPFAPVMALLTRMGDRPAQELIPELVATAYGTAAGRAGIVRTLLFEATSMSPEIQQVFRDTALRVFAMIGQILARDMSAGRLRRMHPMLAIESLVGPVMILVLGGPLLGAAIPDAPSGQAAAMELAAHWLRAMAPET